MNKQTTSQNNSLLSPRTLNVLLWISLALAAFLRFYNLGHGKGYHPDERSMVMTTEGLSLQKLNPQHFAYGSLPYYLLWLVSETLALLWPWLSQYDGLFIVGRILCALFGLGTIWLTYLIARRALQDQFAAVCAATLLGTNVLHLQLSRFFTSDVILSFLCSACLLACLRVLQNQKLSNFFLVGLFTGLAVATKISSFFLAAPIGVTLLFVWKERRWKFSKRMFFEIAIIFVVALSAFSITMPYAWLDYATFSKHMNEQTSMVRGLWRPPYTIQYVGTIPYLYHLSQMYQFTIGAPIFLTIIAGIGCALRDQWRKVDPAILVLLSWALVFFLATGGFMVKYPRYLLPIYPALFICAAYAVSTLLKYVSTSRQHRI